MGVKLGVRRTHDSFLDGWRTDQALGCSGEDVDEELLPRTLGASLNALRLLLLQHLLTPHHLAPLALALLVPLLVGRSAARAPPALRVVLDKVGRDVLSAVRSTG